MSNWNQEFRKEDLFMMDKQQEKSNLPSFFIDNLDSVDAIKKNC